MAEERRQRQQARPPQDSGPISWWSWRPGIRPRHALAIGGLISVVALLLAGIGVVTLVLEVLDSFSPPAQVAATVYSHTVNKLDGQLHLIVHAHTTGFPGVAAPAVSYTLFHSIRDGTNVLLDYSPRLHVLYALELAGQRYTLPGGSIALDVIGSLSLLLIGGVLLPYPALLMLWGWRDILAGRVSAKQQSLNGTVVGLRASVPTGKGRMGLVPRAARPWFGVAIASDRQVTTFALSHEHYVSLREGDRVTITYSPLVHFVYALEQSSE